MADSTDSGFGDSGIDGSSNGAGGWTSEPIPLYKLGNDKSEGEELRDILPKSLCAGGICEGMMPGCQKTQVNPIEIKQIVFRLSRLFKWENHVGPKMRHIIAYGLALLPTAIKVAQKHVVPDSISTETTDESTAGEAGEATMPAAPSTT